MKSQKSEAIVAYAVSPGLVVTEMTKYQAETPRGQQYIPGTKECFEKGMVRDSRECGLLCAWLAERRPKEFSGRSFNVDDNLDKLLSDRNKIIEQDLRYLRRKE